GRGAGRVGADRGGQAPARGRRRGGGLRPVHRRPLRGHRLPAPLRPQAGRAGGVGGRRVPRDGLARAQGLV
ncbi:MAG: hypothetical protein AVDCRST_MAG18-1756, partial [uncultured Thermomicrobiales bacterium]